MQTRKFILTLSCPDRLGLVARITSFLSSHGGDIQELAQFVEISNSKFFMRCVFEFQNTPLDKRSFAALFTSLAQELDLDWDLHPCGKKLRTLLLVSKEAHCLNDLLHRVAHADFPIEPIGVISNHNSLKEMASWYQIPFYHYPISTDTKEKQEKQIYEFIHNNKIDLVVLARYMQILSPGLTERIFGKTINIHHSFLPSFKGAKPYHQAFERGVKLIGATAHFVSDELDEGPIIDQEVIRVGHAHSPDNLVLLGKDIECLVLSRAIKQVAERRVFINGKKTVILN